MGAVLALLSSVMWGSADFMAGTLSRRRPALAVAGSAQVVGLLIMVIVATAAGAWALDTLASVWVWGVLASLSGLTGLVFFYQALAVGRMTIVSPIAALGVLVPLGAGLLTGETPAPWQYLGIVVAVAGVVLACGPELEGSVGLRPVLYAGIAALMFGLFLTFVAVGAQTSAVMTMTTQRATSTLLAVVAALAARSLGGLQPGDLPIIGVIGGFDVGANLIFGIATTMGLLAVISVLGSLYPVVTVLLAWLIHRERLRGVQYLGVSLALVGVIAISAG